MLPEDTFLEIELLGQWTADCKLNLLEMASNKARSTQSKECLCACMFQNSLLLNDFDQHKKKLLKQQLKEAVQKGVWTE
jgi:hypothetical protein